MSLEGGSEDCAHAQPAGGQLHDVGLVFRLPGVSCNSIEAIEWNRSGVARRRRDRRNTAKGAFTNKLFRETHAYQETTQPNVSGAE